MDHVPKILGKNSAFDSVDYNGHLSLTTDNSPLVSYPGPTAEIGPKMKPSSKQTNKISMQAGIYSG